MKHQHVITIPETALEDVRGSLQVLVREFTDGQAAEIEVRLSPGPWGRWMPVELVGGSSRKEVPYRDEENIQCRRS